jgi:hypothetical protein
MSLETIIQVGIQVATVVVAAAGAWAGMKMAISEVKRDAQEGDRKALAAHNRLDELETAVHRDEVLRAGIFAEIRSSLHNLTIEVDRLRKANHDGRAEISGHMARIENDIDELKERIPKERLARG